MMKNRKRRTSLLAAMLSFGVLLGTGISSPVASASTLGEYKLMLQDERDIEALTDENIEKSSEKNEDLWKELGQAKEELEKMRRSRNSSTEDVLSSISMRLDSLEQQLREQSMTQERLIDEVEERNKTYTPPVGSPFAYQAHGATNTKLVNPGPQGTVSYTQDAKNAQHNSTMVFSYAPDQLYKIYCRTGYLTDIELKKGERISFVGGGDTSSWAVNTTTVDGTPHIYVKPVVESSTTNLIITTNKRSYQIILNTSNWYNPMVKWSYELDDAQAIAVQNQRDAETITADMNVASFDSLHFGYETSVKGSSRYKPEMIFDDGSKTVIQFAKNADRLPALFLKEPGKKDLSLANFKTKGNCYIIDRLIDRAELRYSDTDIVTIKRKK